MPGQTVFGLISDLAPRAGSIDGNDFQVMPGGATTQIDFGDSLEWVDEAARTVKKFDGVGTICGFAGRDLSRVHGVGYSIGDAVNIVYRGTIWVKTAAALTVGAAVAGVASSVVRKVATDGAQNLALIQINHPPRGVAIP